jgi:flagellum-specific peptidoglycan hydrolase FlgJ
MSKQTDFINLYANAVIKGSVPFKIFPSITMAQMIIESGWGNSNPLSTKYNNFFGIKASRAWTGQTIQLNTPKDAKPISTFRVYNSPLESIQDHSKFLVENKRYERGGVFNAKTPEEQALAIAKSGYAESVTYADTLVNLINRYNLKELDKKKSSGGLIIILPFLFIASYIYLKK